MSDEIFLAGASGVIGIRLTPLLIDAGHEVAAMTRSPAKADALGEFGAEPVVCHVYDADALREAVLAFGPEVVMHQLTDLPDDASQIQEFGPRNDRIRREGTRNLLDAAAARRESPLRRASPGSFRATAAPPTSSSSARWSTPAAWSSATGSCTGPGPTTSTGLHPPRVSVDEAARRTLPLLDSKPGIVEVAE